MSEKLEREIQALLEDYKRRIDEQDPDMYVLWLISAELRKFLEPAK